MTRNPSNALKFCKARLLDSKYRSFYRLLLVKFLKKTCFFIQVIAEGTAKIHSKNMPNTRVIFEWRMNWLFIICIHDRLSAFKGDALVLHPKPKYVTSVSLLPPHVFAVLADYNILYWKIDPEDLCTFLCLYWPNPTLRSSVQHNAQTSITWSISFLKAFLI